MACPIAIQQQQEAAGILLLIVPPWPPPEVAGAESGRLMGHAGLVVEYQRLVLVRTTQLIGCPLYCWQCSGVGAVLNSLVQCSGVQFGVVAVQCSGVNVV